MLFLSTTVPKLCDDQRHSFHLPCVHCSALCRVNASRIDIGVTQDICQSAQIMLQRIVRPGKQVTQIVGKYLFGIHIGTLAKSLHIPPDIGSIQRLAGLGGKHRASSLFLFLDILPKQFA